MRRVLITTTYFADEVYLGTLRVTALAKYLPELGWEPVILSPRVPGALAVDDPAVPVIQFADIKSPYGAVKRALGGKPRMTLEESTPSPTSTQAVAAIVVRTLRSAMIPDPSVVWWPFAVHAALREARRRPVDAILSTSNPPTPHLIAATLRRRLNVPWVADFRDLWTLNHYREVGERRHRIEQAMERRAVRGADMIVTITDEYVERLRAFLAPSAPPMATIPLGVDPEVLPAASTPLTEQFTLTYTGTFIEGRRDPRTLFAGVRLAVDRGWVDLDRLSIRFYGPSYDFVEAAAAEAGLVDVVHQHGYVPRTEALAHQRESQVVLLFLWNHLHEAGAFSGKLEFLFSGRPVLVTGGPPTGVWRRLVDASGAGAYAQTAEDVSEYLRSAFRAYIQQGSAPAPTDTSMLASLQYPNIVRQFAEILDQLVT